MQKLTDQEIFDNAALGIASQGYRPAIDSKGQCRVLTCDGLRCAIGWSVTDAEPGDATSPQWNRLAGSNMVSQLQLAHDTTLVRCGKGAWRTRMAKIALTHGLDDSTLWFEVN